MFHTNPLKMPFLLALFLFQVPQNFNSTSPYSYKVSYKWGIKIKFRVTVSFFFLFMTSNHSIAAGLSLDCSPPLLGCLGLVCRSTRPQTNPSSSCRPQKTQKRVFSQLPFLPSLPGMYGWDRDMEGTHCGTNIPSSIQWDSYTTAPVPSRQTV